MDDGQRMPKWFALQVRTNYEKVAAVHLQQRGQEVFVPTFSIQRRWSDRIKKVEIPVFQGYVFCHCDLRRDPCLVTAPGVIRIVGNGSTPIPIPDEEIKSIDLSTRSGLPVEPCAMPEPGQLFEVIDGPLRGITGIVRSRENDSRLVITVGLLQRGIAVKVDRKWIALPGSHANAVRAEMGVQQPAIN